jgi:uncharacterized NAD(P)/FAD-binding protein YdhS
VRLDSINGAAMALTQQLRGEDVRTIAIIGGGFCGVAAAVYLLRQPHAEPTRIVLIERSPGLGRGAAYATRDYAYLLNVPAGQMSLFADAPADFTQFAQEHSQFASATDFLPRSLYGDYLASRLAAAVQDAAGRIPFIRMAGEAIRLERLAGRRPEFARWNLWLADGRDLIANGVVLALGNPEPRTPDELVPIVHSAAYVHDPWAYRHTDLRAVRERERVLLIGTGLTMADVAVRLVQGDRPPAEIHALSRHALLPAAQTDFDRSHPRAGDRNQLSRAHASLRAFTRAARMLAAGVEARNDDWRSVVAMIRSELPQLWQRLDERDRRRFLRHLRPVWEVHRHRMAPVIAGQLARMRESGLLTLTAGRLLRAEPLKQGVQVIWRARGSEQERAAVYDRVFNCTGPDFALSRSCDPLVRSLLRARWIAADALELGIETDADYRALNPHGIASDGLYYLGPWLRARFWESTAVPELRLHAERLAGLLAASANTAHRVGRVANG